MIVAPAHAVWYFETQTAMAFFWADEPEALMEPVAQLMAPDGEAEVPFLLLELQPESTRRATVLAAASVIKRLRTDASLSEEVACVNHAREPMQSRGESKVNGRRQLVYRLAKEYAYGTLSGRLTGGDVALNGQRPHVPVHDRAVDHEEPAGRQGSV